MRNPKHFWLGAALVVAALVRRLFHRLQLLHSPSLSILLPELSARSVGALLALYEASIFVAIFVERRKGVELELADDVTTEIDAAGGDA